MTNETQKTAVEWYSRRLFEIEIAHNQGVINRDVYLKSKTHAFEQAKEMEKERIIKGYANGHNDGCRYMNNEKQQFEHGEQYYEQTYGGGEQ